MPRPKSDLVCTDPVCDRPARSLGMCKTHYMAARRAMGLYKSSAKPHQRKGSGVQRVVGDYSYPDVHRGAPGGQRLCAYTCPRCKGEHLVAWAPFDVHPGLKSSTCQESAAKGGAKPMMFEVLAPPPERQYDQPPAERQDKGVPLERVRLARW